MKTKILNIKDFEIEKLNKEAQKVIRGGDGDPVDPTNNPAKGSGNGSG
ncbi:rSAM-modified peptide [Flavobacterium ginsenosidimutans]|uniref:RSAM-modified peptide n=1 Tax=Flavobacterium ginsenosidimutans TaxID=687844 RepID=A0ABZ2QEK9_9FLAO|nr:rSAM-modified peptide [Flavobacterium ginsenosidimutans]KAF2332276.1 rSAM-modified peptide [Flavobacterium ginsenosidimutans]